MNVETIAIQPGLQVQPKISNANTSHSIAPTQFEQTLNETIPTTTRLDETKNGTSTDATGEIDQLDEEKAAKELFSLMRMLYSGIIDYSKLERSDSKSEVDNGPIRAELENIKNVIRSIAKIIGTQTSDGSFPHAKDINSEEIMEELTISFQSLPDFVKNLLSKAFPGLDTFLEEIKEILTAQKASILKDEKEKKTVAPPTGSDEEMVDNALGLINGLTKREQGTDEEKSAEFIKYSRVY